MVPFNAKVSGIGGSVTVRHKGKGQWVWEDDLGQTTVHDIPDTLFMPNSPDHIFSPQHWAQVRASCDQDDSSHCITDPNLIRFVWAHGEHTKTVALDPHTNVAIVRASPEVTLDTLPNVASDDKFDPRDPSNRDSVGDISFAHPIDRGYIPQVFAFENPYPLNTEESDLFYFLLIRTKRPTSPKLQRAISSSSKLHAIQRTPRDNTTLAFLLIICQKADTRGMRKSVLIVPSVLDFALTL